MSVITFEDILPDQTSESFNPSKQPKSEDTLSSPTANLAQTVLNSEVKKDSTLPNNIVATPLPKPTGNTPRFGVKKITFLNPLKHKPTKLITKINEKCLSENSPIVRGRVENIEGFESLQEGGTPSYVSLSPTSQIRLETGSVGNSPRKRPPTLKHPLISKKSPLFQKFGLDAWSFSQNNPSNGGTVDGYEVFLQEKKQLKVATPPIEGEIMNIQERANLSQMIDKSFETKKITASEYIRANSQNNQSLSMVSSDKSKEKHTFYSGKKIDLAPHESSGFSKPGLDVYNSESHLNSEPPLDSTNSMINVMKTKASNLKENMPIGGSDSKPPHQAFSQNNSFLNAKSRQTPLLGNFPKASALKTSHTSEENQEFRRKVIQHTKRVIFNKNRVLVTAKDGFNDSLELSAIQDSHEKDVLNISKDDALLQCLEKCSVERETYEKNPLKVIKQLQEESNNENILSSRSIKKSNSGSHIEPFEVIGQEEAIQVIEQTKMGHVQKRIGRMSAKAYGSYDNIVRIPSRSNSQRVSGNRDRNTSMYEIAGSGKEKENTSEKKVPERFRQRRVESALPRPSDPFYDSTNANAFGWKERSQKSFSKTKQRLPNSEKNNIKHFRFQGSPSLNSSMLDGQEDHKKDFHRIHLNSKPGTSGCLSRSYVKKERIGIPNRIPSVKNTFAFQSVGHNSSQLNDSGFLFEDSTHLNSVNEKIDTNILPSFEHGKFLSNLEENNVQKLRDEILRLQMKDQESQIKIMKLQLQIEKQNKEWENRLEVTDLKWRRQMGKQRDFYEQRFGGSQSRLSQRKNVSLL